MFSAVDRIGCEVNPSVAVSNLFIDPGPLLQIFIISNKNNVIDDLSVFVWITDISRKRERMLHAQSV